MYELARSIGSAACSAIDSISPCETMDELTVVGFTIMTLVSAAVVMFALMHLNRVT